MALTKLTTDLIDGSLGTDWQATPKTANFTATAGKGYFVDTTSTAITVTLPSSPTAGDEISLVDYGANASTNNITITSSDNIEGAADDLVLSTDKVSKTLVYSDATKGWLVTTEAEGVAAVPSEFTTDYLVVAGGGGGGGGNYGDGSAGGGGAGGLRTSYGSTSGGGASAESSLTLNITTTYTISVGPGGAGAVAGQNPGSNGTNSYISGTGITTITSNGGGGGDCQNGSAAPTGGGSGGGGAGGGFPVASYGAAGTANQGYAGGDAYNAGGDGSSNYLGGGGGGAGAAGDDATNTVAGNGGAGLAVGITGSSVAYAGGGGSGDNKYGSAPGVAGTGGSGGGGNGGINGLIGSSGTPNTGGGGGGGSADVDDNAGGNGGAGVVILRYPDVYNITETTSPNVLTYTTAPSSVSGYKITTFTAGENGTIQFTAV